MAKTKLSDLGSSVCVDPEGQKFVPALGDGNAVPGELVYIDPADGKAKGADAGLVEFFSGILMESKITGTETAIVAGVPCTVVIPKSGKNYRIRANAVTGATDEHGGGVTFSAIGGEGDTTAVTLANSKIGRLAAEALVDDTVCEITWIE